MASHLKRGSRNDYSLYEEQRRWREGLAADCVDAIDGYLAGGNRGRRIDQLQNHEKVGIAWAIIAEYDQRRLAKAEELISRGVDPGQLLDPLERLLRELGSESTEQT